MKFLIEDKLPGQVDISTLEDELSKEYPIEGISKNMTIEDIAKKHNVSVEDIEVQVKKGIKVEKEHTHDEKKAERIALDHLFEIPDYYDKLAKMEKGALKESRYITYKGYEIEKDYNGEDIWDFDYRVELNGRTHKFTSKEDAIDFIDKFGKLEEAKKKKELGAFVKLDAGDVEEGNKFFNKAVAGVESEGGCNMSEDLKTINIRDELNKLDTIDYNDLVNMYDCVKLSDLEKTQLAQLLSNHDNENAIKFISDRYYEENICEDNDKQRIEQDTEVSVSLGNKIKQIYDADAEQADIQYENKNYKAWDAFDKKWEPLHLLLVQYDRHNRRPLEKVIDRMRPEDQKQLIDRYLKENLQEQNFDDNMPEWLSRRDRLSKRLSEINQERAEIEKTIDYQQDHNYSMIDFDLMDRLDELNMEAEIINKKLEEI